LDLLITIDRRGGPGILNRVALILCVYFALVCRKPSQGHGLAPLSIC